MVAHILLNVKYYIILAIINMIIKVEWDSMVILHGNNINNIATLKEIIIMFNVMTL